MSDIQKLYNMPDISFVDTKVETLLASMITDYQNAYYQSTGEQKTLAAGDPVRIWIYAQALRIYAIYQLIEFSAKQNLLKYAQDNYLINIGARVGETPDVALAATTIEQFNLSAIQSRVIPIPHGTRVTPGNNIFFATTEYAEIPAGELSINLLLQCIEPGAAGNGFMPGQINILVDPIQYMASVTNIDTSQGGTNSFIIGDATSNESLREKIFLKPNSFSVAGPEGAYEYFAKKYNGAIADVAISSPAAGTVDIRLILQNGKIPQQSMIDGLLAYLAADNRRPLTDYVTVGAPEQIDYDIDLTFYIKTADASFATSIQNAVNTAVANYRLWQRLKIGRDINPDYLRWLIIQAGAKRVVINSPSFTPILATQVAAEGTVTVNYGGLEEE